MPYVVMKGNLFVAKPGSYNSYTTLPQWARTYDSLQEAKADCCGNEKVMFMTYLFHLAPPTEQKGSSDVT